jgi:hypothetical protein
MREEWTKCTSMDLVMISRLQQPRVSTSTENPGNLEMESHKRAPCTIIMQLTAPCSSPCPAAALPPHLTQNCAVGL